MLCKLISALPRVQPRRRVALSSSKRAHVSAVGTRRIDEGWRYECRRYAFGQATPACRKKSDAHPCQFFRVDKRVITL